MVLREMCYLRKASHPRRPGSSLQRPRTSINSSLQVIIGDGSTTISVTCFSNQANSLIIDCNELLAELSNKDPYQLPSTLRDLEGTAHIFQFYFDAGSTSNRRDFVLDRVFKNTVLPLPAPPVQNITLVPTPTEQLEHTPLPKPLSPALSTTTSNEPDSYEGIIGDFQQIQPPPLHPQTPMETQQGGKPYHLPPLSAKDVISDVTSKNETSEFNKPKADEDVTEYSQDLQSTPPQIQVPTETHKGNQAANPQRSFARKSLFKTNPRIKSSKHTKKSKQDN
ncbi:hypothetical protein Tco_1086684 [Tanacetum coccineum]